MKFEWRENGIPNSISLGVTHLPNRKNPALYIMRGERVEILAYFKSEECSKRFNSALDSIVDLLDKIIIANKLNDGTKK